MNQIKNVIPHEGCLLEVQLENGSSVILNFTSRLHTVRFGMLTDKAFFKRAVTDGDCIRWDNKIEISASEVFSWHKRRNYEEENHGEIFKNQYKYFVK